MKKIKNEHLSGLSSMSDLRAMRELVDRQTSNLEKRMRGSAAQAKEMFSFKGILKTALGALGNVRNVFRIR